MIETKITETKSVSRKKKREHGKYYVNEYQCYSKQFLP